LKLTQSYTHIERVYGLVLLEALVKGVDALLGFCDLELLLQVFEGCLQSRNRGLLQLLVLILHPVHLIPQRVSILPEVLL
jgi:hypothetical protein